jgi:hypothetical protein
LAALTLSVSDQTLESAPAAASFTSSNPILRHKPAGQNSANATAEPITKPVPPTSTPSRQPTLNPPPSKNDQVTKYLHFFRKPKNRSSYLPIMGSETNQIDHGKLFGGDRAALGGIEFGKAAQEQCNILSEGQ